MFQNQILKNDELVLPKDVDPAKFMNASFWDQLDMIVLNNRLTELESIIVKVNNEINMTV
jgi:hypothetical protein